MFVQGSTENQFYWVDFLFKNYNYNYNTICTVVYIIYGLTLVSSRKPDPFFAGRLSIGDYERPLRKDLVKLSTPYNILLENFDEGEVWRIWQILTKLSS